MIFGHVRDNMPRLQLEILSAGSVASIEVTIDTAFDGELALPLSVLERFGGQYLFELPVSRADGSERGAGVYEVTILWHGAQTEVKALSLSDNGNPLLGVELLADNLVTLEMTDGGEVTIEPL